MASTMDRGTRTLVDDRYLSLKDYAFIGDCRTGALVSKAGSVGWLCLPEFFADSVFAALLDADKGGYFAIRPTGRYETSRRYLPGTAVLETTFDCDDGVFRLTDCLALVACDGLRELQPERELLRKIEVVDGAPEVEAVFAPRPNYGRGSGRIVPRGKLGWTFGQGNRLFVLRSTLPLVIQTDNLIGRCRLSAGEQHYFSFSFSCASDDVAIFPPLGEEAEQRLRSTVAWWQDWSECCRYQGPYREIVLRSAITLKLLSCALSGAVIAAPTTSLPEEIGGARNWDYRYCWLRDAAFTLRAFMDLGYDGEAESFFSWLLHATHLTWPELDVLYTVYGRSPGSETELRHLNGYRGSRPVRVGNGASGQLQLDMYGELILAVHDYVSRGVQLDDYERRLLVGFGETVCRQWQEPDYSIWEVRGEPRHYTFSKLMCWTALDCLLDLHAHGYLRVPEREFRQVRDAIGAAIEAHAFQPELGAYTGVFDDVAADAALLQMAHVGYRQAGDGRLASSYDYIWRQLAQTGLIKRYGAGFDGLAGTEGAFGACTFWAVKHLVREGQLEEARQLFEHALGFANDLGLLAEEIDPASGEALGNYPQAFTHVGLIDAALALAAAEKTAEKSYSTKVGLRE